MQIYLSLPTVSEEIFAGINFRESSFEHFAGINFRELGFTEGFAGINFGELGFIRISRELVFANWV